MREKERKSGRNTAFVRITPAYAGKSERFWSRKDTLEDHPRVCGEKYFTIRDKVAKKGSPRVCGEKERRQPHIGQRRGITPRMRGKD